MKFTEKKCKILISENLDKGYDRKYSYEWHDPNTFETFIVRFDNFGELSEHPHIKRLMSNPTFSNFEIENNRLTYVAKDGKRFTFGKFDNVGGLVV